MKILKRSIHILSVNLRELILFEILYRTATGIVLLSLFTRGISLAIKYSGYSYLTTKNIWMFLMKPCTALILSAVMCVGLFFLVVEAAALLSAYQSAERCERLPAYKIFVRGLFKSGYYLKKRNISVVCSNCLLTLVFHYVLFLKGMEHIKLFSEIMDGVGKSMRWSAFFVIFAVAVVFVLLPGMFSVHFGLLDKKDAKEAYRESWRMASRHAVSAVLYLLGLNVLLYLLFRLVLTVLTVLAGLVIYLFVSKTITLALFLTVHDWLEVGCLAAASIVNCMCNMALLTGLYYHYRDKAGMAPELLAPEEEEGRTSRRNKRTRAALAAVFLISFCLFLYDAVENGIRFAKDILVETAITAHRGSSMEAPENTLPAVQLAIEEMADYVEIDVQLSQDGEIILLHDRSFKRTCNHGGNPWNMTLSEIRQLNAAAYMPDYDRTQIPTLGEILECCKDKINLNIELKNNGHDELLPRKVTELVESFDMNDQCVFTSTSIPFLEKVKECNEEYKTGYILSTAYGDFSQNTGTDFFSISSSLLNEKTVAQIHETGREVHAWTVNTEAEAERLKYLDVDNIITDYPVMVREILYREKDTENFLEFLSMVLD